MKNYIKYTLSFVAISAAAFMLVKTSRAEWADDTPELISQYKEGGGVATAKSVSSQNEDGSYTITLETFARGGSELEVKSVPSDVILVLDMSSSMSGSYGSTTRLQALKNAVVKFAGSIFDNAEEARKTDPEFKNRLAIITYDRSATMVQDWISVDNTVISKNANGTYSGTLVNTINGISAGHGTRPDHGLHMAIDMLLDGSPSSKRTGVNLTVLLFTDGYPTDNNASNWGEPTGDMDTDKLENSFANKTLYYGSIVKQTYGAKLYTVGLITSRDKPADPMFRYYQGRPNQNANAWTNAWRWRNYCRVLQLMDWLSSNYPDSQWGAGVVNQNQLAIETPSNANPPTEGATDYRYYAGFTGNGNVFNGEDNIPAPWKNEWVYSNSNAAPDVVTLAGFVPGSTDTDGDKFTWDTGYFKIIDNDTSFDSVFTEIAEASGGSAESIPETTQIRDVVSNSFVLPDGAASDLSKINLTIMSVKINSDASAWDADTTVYYLKGVDKQAATANPKIVPVVDSLVSEVDGKKRAALVVEGFNYSEDDNPENSGNGNWVGIRYNSSNQPYYAGRKLVIQFDIHYDGEATGGQGTATNTTDSGVWVLQEDGTYKNINSYEVPRTTLPINIKIEKTGLRHGESATFEIHRAEPLMVNGEIQYNALGKMRPDPDTWNEDFSKVIITNKGANGEKVTKMLLSLDPAYVYRIVEDKWGWSYEMTGQGGVLSTDVVEINPFKFNNDEKEDAVKHAEAVTVNHFSTRTNDSYEEHYKSSKVESF